MTGQAALTAAFFDRDVLAVARELIGATLLVEGVGGAIVETEAYDPDEPASHAFRGRTARNAVMFGPPGRAYVYFTYGMHWCLNFVCGAEGHATAVLIRALAPEAGLEAMRARRGVEALRLLCSGPARLTQALGVTNRHNGLALAAPPFLVLERAAAPAIAVGPRIGISQAKDLPWRFGLAGSPFLSRPFPA